MNSKRNISIRVPVLTRVEGEGALELDINDGQIDTLHLRIYEPPRYFEQFLKGHPYQEVPDITARICGICPVAYQMSAVQALEQALDFQASDWVIRMRRLLYCGEWVQSHSLHIHLLALPDFLGFDSALEMAQDHPDVLQRGLKLQALGNDMIRLLGGRSVHPVGVLPGGFYKAPEKKAVGELLGKLQSALADCYDMIDWLCRLPLPSVEQDFVSVGLRHSDEYALYSGRIVSDQGLDISVDEYEQHFAEHHAPHSTALHALHHGKPYLVGPLARVNLNYHQLPSSITSRLEDNGIEFPSKNVFNSIIARAVELTLCIEQAMEILSDYEPTQHPYGKLTIRAAIGYGASEAPRGLLWHKYEIDEQGYIQYANIIPPTSQNQAQVEQDLHHSIMQQGMNMNDDELRLFSESIIRNYDPCISCATHFLKLKVNRN